MLSVDQTNGYCKRFSPRNARCEFPTRGKTRHLTVCFGKKITPPCLRQLFFIYKSRYQSCVGAPTGQVSAQAPQSMQASSSITYLPSPSLIASTGQPAAHAPQEMHSSEILYAIVRSSFSWFEIIVAYILKISIPASRFFYEIGNF